MSSEVTQFIEDYAVELVSGNAAYFVGAGISVDSGLPNWNKLITPFTKKIGVASLEGKDMPLMAQYVINEETGNRGPFINAISRKLRGRFTANSYHEAIVRTNIKTIWTTNYDNLLEKAFANATVDVKFNDESISRDVPDSHLEIIKMHGCIYNSKRDEIVITQSDYEDFFQNRPATAQRLRLDLLQKSFLFIGYGYGDANIKNIITEARRLSGNNTRQHYMIVKDDTGNREFELWCNNLRRYGIRVIKIAKYSDLLSILQKLSLKSRGNSIFITGSHEPNSNIEAEKLGEALAKEDDIILNDGQSEGIMRVASRAYMETIINNKSDINKRLNFFPNPYAANPKFAKDPSLLPMLKQWRVPLLRATHVVVAFDGGMGSKAEIETALDMGCIVIPVFKEKGKETWQLLDNNVIRDRILKYSDNYLDKMKNGSVSHNAILDLIRKIVN